MVLHEEVESENCGRDFSLKPWSICRHSLSLHMPFQEDSQIRIGSWLLLRSLNHWNSPAKSVS